MKIFEFKQKAEALKADMRALVEKEDFSDADSTEFDAKKVELDGIQTRVAKLEALGEEEVAEVPAQRTSKPVEFTQAPAVHTKEHKYSLVRAINSVINKGHVDGYEKEVSDQISERSGRQAQGFYVPHGEHRDLTTVTGAGSIKTLYDGTLIEALYAKMVLKQAGAKVLTGLRGGFSLPVQTGSHQAYWVAEGVAPTESNAAFTAITIAPKTVGAWTTVSRKFLIQATLDVENWIKDDLSSTISREIDRAAINGSGSGAEPMGLLTYAGITTVSGGTDGGVPTFANIVAMESAVSSAHADTGKLAYITNSSVLGALKTTPKLGTTYPIFLYDGDSLNGHPMFVTNQFPNNLTKGSGTALSGMVYGDWANYLVAYFGGGTDLLVDPYSESTSGNVRIVALTDCDLKPLRTASFARMVDIKTS